MDERLITYALEILKRRAQDEYNRYSREEQLCYDSAVTILTAAIDGEEDILRQFDY